MDTYSIGSEPRSIKLTADITTIGMAATRAFSIDGPPDFKPTGVAASVNATGDIKLAEIGMPMVLTGKVLFIVTTIRLTGADIQTRKKAFENIEALYMLDSGFEGHKEFMEPDIIIDLNNNFTDIELNKSIKLLP
ncbi:hypothetical protein SAMN05518672_10453 [Chitinophaga sp. CF118]|uniref:hypothetical protein n=1 Tax=Chitinophaga sp. CF118 TaxID=1884367 RepID=UPI0008E0BF25|nr:hypothetical protein [Chitinophaga sp. CF118]SFD98839.1 hypothetical protein SAMN05518672_10453 [Chitinophaga sp. CF118]